MKEQPNKETSTRRGLHTEGTLYKGDINAEGIYTYILSSLDFGV